MGEYKEVHKISNFANQGHYNDYIKEKQLPNKVERET